MIEEHLQSALNELGLDLPGTAKRIAKMYKEEIFTGLLPDNFPKISLFDAEERQEITIKEIQFVSYCEHHLLPMFGKATISYTPHEQIMGLSTIHEVVHYFAKRPQLQERLTSQIANCLARYLECEVSVEIEAEHSCVRARGVMDQASVMVTRSSSEVGVSHNLD